MVDITICEETLNCPIQVPLLNITGSLTIVAHAGFNYCDDSVCLSCEDSVVFDVVCPFCPDESVSCPDLNDLEICDMFTVQNVSASQPDGPGGDVTITGEILFNCDVLRP